MLDRSRFRGCLLGLACGDAVGTAVEFQAPGSFEPVRDMTGGGAFGLEPGQWTLEPGQWTDDTSMALCLAASLVDRGWDPRDQMERYVRWWREGYYGSTGFCVDIGGATHAALSRFVRTGDPFSGSEDPYSAGNGSLMRLAPVAMFYAASPEEAIERAAESSRTTHAAATAVDACRYFAGLLVSALEGALKEQLIEPLHAPCPNYWQTHSLHPEIAEVAGGSFRRREPPEIQGAGFVVRSLEAALWAFDRSKSFEEAVLKAANLGRDADTTAAICGQIAGAHYGARGIPQHWLGRLCMREEIERLADELFARASGARS
jgi:ADP-ribosylglycohydrolase